MNAHFIRRIGFGMLNRRSGLRMIWAFSVRTWSMRIVGTVNRERQSWTVAFLGAQNWLPSLNVIRTFLLAPPPEARALLSQVANFVAACAA